MYFTTVIIPIVFFIGSVILFIYMRTISSLLMAIGFLVVSSIALLPFLFPIELNTMSSDASAQFGHWERVRILSYISSSGSLVSVVGFLWVVFDVRNKIKNGKF